VNCIGTGTFAAALLLLLTTTNPAFAQQPAPPPAQPGESPQPGSPAGPPQPGAPAEPPPAEEPAPTTEAPPAAPVPSERGSAGGVVPEDLLQAEQPTVTRPPTFLGPDLFNPPVPRGWITLTPTFTLSGRYDDNIFASDQNRKSDFIFGFTPGVTLSMQRPEYRLLAGYNVGFEIFAKDSDQNSYAGRQQFFADGFYVLSPRTRLTLDERLIYDDDTSSVSSDNVSAGEKQSLRNTVILGVQHELTELTTLRASFSQTHKSFFGDTDARNSDTFRLLVGADYQFTARLRGIAEFESAYLRVETEPDAFTQIPRFGFDYQFTQTLRGGLSAGPSFINLDNGESKIEPAVTARLAQLFSFGSLRAVYDYAQVAGTLGLSNRHSIYATLRVDRLVRNLVFEVTPRYTISDFLDPDKGGTATSRHTDALNLDLRATYQLTQSIALIGSYRFFYQHRSNGTTETIDRNRVFLGAQYSFPITVY
jgi:predicted porin